jgi:GDP-L-fucose synthase
LINRGYGCKENGGKISTPSSKELNLLNTNDVFKWFKINKPDIVVLAAAKVGGILANSKNPADFLFNNLKIQTNVIEAAWKANCKRFLFLGSSCIYPKFADQPIEEKSLLSGSLETTNQWYGIAKIAGIKLCEALRLQYNFDAISLMPTNLYGPGDNYDDSESHVMASLIKKFTLARINSLDHVVCWGTGTPLREFMHVEDLGEAIVFALENWNPNSNNAPKDSEGKKLTFLNVGVGRDISIFDLAKKIKNFTQFKGKVVWDKSKPNGTPKKQLNIEKILSLGWSPKINLDIGIKKTIEDYKNIITQI